MSFWNWLKSWFAPKAEQNPDPASPPIENVSPVPVQTSAAPWLDEAAKFEGMSEDKNDKELSAGWIYCGHGDWHTVRGADHAWCAMFVGWMLRRAGYKGTNSAAAISYKHYGTPCEDKDGAILVVEHANGRHHVTFRRRRKFFGGNQRNMVCAVDPAPGDKIIACRWPVKG